MDRDENSPRTGYMARSYQKILKEGLLPYYEPRDIFQQDNVSIHFTKTVKQWFEEYRICVIDWPVHSLDLNPIEHIWIFLKQQLYRLYPDLYTLKDNELDRAEFERMVRTAWWAIPQAKIDKLVKSMPRRLRAIYRAKGWYTKY